MLPYGCDVVLRAKPTAAQSSFDSLNEQIKKIFGKIAKNLQDQNQLMQTMCLKTSEDSDSKASSQEQ